MLIKVIFSENPEGRRRQQPIRRAGRVEPLPKCDHLGVVDVIPLDAGTGAQSQRPAVQAAPDVQHGRLGVHGQRTRGELEDPGFHRAREALAGLIHFRHDDIAPADLTARLYDKNILIRHVPQPVLNRVATGFYNTEGDVDALVEGIRHVVETL